TRSEIGRLRPPALGHGVGEGRRSILTVDLPAIAELLDKLGDDDEVAALVAALMELHRCALERAVAIDAEIARDELVADVLLLHGLHPEPLVQRIEAALDRVRPAIAAHAAGVELLGVDDNGVAHMRLDGAYRGGTSATATLRTLIEAQLARAAPDLLGLDVEG